MPRGHSPYIDDPYGSFVADIRLAIIRATSFDRTDAMSNDELAIIKEVAATLYRLDPHAEEVMPARTNRPSAAAMGDAKRRL